jgi:hypothetical protein
VESGLRDRESDGICSEWSTDTGLTYEPREDH